MHYVKHFKINGVDTTQVGCIELQGVPNAATEGAVGVLGIDITSPTHDVYKCVAVNGSIYTWELLSSGMSIVCATITGEGAISKTFHYSNLLIPNSYLIKRGDLILDSEGYLYQITSIGAESCVASYSGTHIDGTGGRNDYKLAVKDGKLQLVTDSGNVVSSIDYLTVDEETLTCDESTGILSVIGIKTIDGTLLRLFVGTKAQYAALTESQKQNLFAIITDDDTQEKLSGALSDIEGIKDGTVVAKKAESATKATRDGDDNLIPNTYAKKSDLTNGNVVPKRAQTCHKVQSGQVTEVTITDGVATAALVANQVYLIQIYITSGIDGNPFSTTVLLCINGNGVPSYSTVGGGYSSNSNLLIKYTPSEAEVRLLYLKYYDSGLSNIVSTDNGTLKIINVASMVQYS